MRALHATIVGRDVEDDLETGTDRHLRGRRRAALGAHPRAHRRGLRGPRGGRRAPGGAGVLRRAAGPARARRRPARRRRARRLPGAARARRRCAGDLPHGPRPADRPALGLPCRRRRLPDQAVRARRAARAHPRAAQAPARRRRGRTAGARSRAARTPGGRALHSADADRVPAARGAGRTARRGGAPARARVRRLAGWRDRPREHARRVHHPAAAQAARGRGGERDRDHARRRVRAAVSLRTRVTLSTIAVLGAGLAIISIALNLLLAGRLSADASSVLATRAATLDSLDDAALDQPAWIFDAQGRAIQRSPASPRLMRAVDALGRVDRATERNPTEHVRLLARPIDGAGVVVVGVSMDPYRHTERLAIAFTVILDAFVLIAGALVAPRAVGAALRPVAEMTERAAEWSEHDLHRRFEVGPPRDELTALAATLNGLLGRLDAALRHEQRFSAEMAHELRTPLAGVRAEAELALRSGTAPREALEAVLAGTERMETVIDTLLAAARSDHVRGSSDAVAAARRAAEPHGAGVHAQQEPMTVGAGEDVVAGALQPLLENAVRHAAHEVDVRVSRGQGDVVIAVLDDGSGIAPGDAQRIFEPGVSDAGGAGLGLPLARRLARAAGGDVVAIPQQG